jgi:hypothetical protein
MGILSGGTISQILDRSIARNKPAMSPRKDGHPEDQA